MLNKDVFENAMHFAQNSSEGPCLKCFKETTKKYMNVFFLCKKCDKDVKKVGDSVGKKIKNFSGNNYWDLVKCVREDISFKKAIEINLHTQLFSCTFCSMNLHEYWSCQLLSDFEGQMMDLYKRLERSDERFLEYFNITYDHLIIPFTKVIMQIHNMPYELSNYKRETCLKAICAYVKKLIKADDIVNRLCEIDRSLTLSQGLVRSEECYREEEMEIVLNCGRCGLNELEENDTCSFLCHHSYCISCLNEFIHEKEPVCQVCKEEIKVKRFGNLKNNNY